jgi:membrane protein
VRSLSTYKMLYGSVGSIIAILLWIYVSGTLVALGAEINFVLAARRGGAITPPPREPADRPAGR